LKNSDCLKTFEKSLELFIKKQLDELDQNIEADKRLADSKGLNGSGAMINGTKNRCIRLLESRVDEIFRTLSELPFKYSRKLGDNIYEISLKYFPSGLGEIYNRLDDVFIEYQYNERVREDIVKQVEDAKKTEIGRYNNKLGKFLINLKNKENSKSKRLWEHPVWSKVIGGLILLIILEIIRRGWNYYVK